jgi:hypothetical protein
LAFVGLVAAAIVLGIFVGMAIDSPPREVTATSSATRATSSTIPDSGDTAVATTTAASAEADPMVVPRRGDVLISGAEGVRVIRDASVVGRAVTEPTANAVATADGYVAHHRPPADEYPDYWPGTEPIGGPELWLTTPDGTVSLLYQGGSAMRIFEMAEIDAIADAPCVVGMRIDGSTDGAIQYSLAVIPIDGSPPLVVTDLPRIVGATSFDSFFVLAVTNEARTSSHIMAIGLAGQDVAWPLNPEPEGARTSTRQITALTRLGTTATLVYATTDGGPWEGDDRLTVYDTRTGAPTADRDVGTVDAMIAALHASDEFLAVTRVFETRVQQRWSLTYMPLTLYDTDSWGLAPTSIPGGGAFTVVD